MSVKNNNDPSVKSPDMPATAGHRWRPYASTGTTVVGVALAASVTSYVAEKSVGIAAWVAVAVVGASGLISTARNSP